MGNSNERVVNGVKTRVLHNKDYVEVVERVRIAHEVEDDFEQIETIHFAIETRWFVRCVIRVKGKQYMGTAEIKFDAPKNTPDGSNPFECAETSAMGRALGFAGLGTVESISSYDEITRGKPFTAVVEDSHNQVVESKESPRQLNASVPTPEALNQECDKLFGEGQWEAVKAVLFGQAVANEEMSVDQRKSAAQALKAKVTDQQIASIRKLCQHLGKAEPENIESLNYIVARRTIQILTAEYKEAKQQKAS